MEIGNYIKDVREDERFHDLKSIVDLAKKMVEEKKHIIFPKIYLLMKLTRSNSKCRTRIFSNEVDKD